MKTLTTMSIKMTYDDLRLIAEACRQAAFRHDVLRKKSKNAENIEYHRNVSAVYAASCYTYSEFADMMEPHFFIEEP